MVVLEPEEAAGQDVSELRGPLPAPPMVLLQESVIDRPRNAGSRLKGSRGAEQLKILVARRAS